jgi:hypothetical protein
MVMVTPSTAGWRPSISPADRRRPVLRRPFEQTTPLQSVTLTLSVGGGFIVTVARLMACAPQVCAIESLRPRGEKRSSWR